LLLGSYEYELHPVINSFMRGSYDRVIDIGCGEGYYAVGLALKLGCAVFAFDTEPRERAFCRKMAAENAVLDKIHLNGWCDSMRLKELIYGKSLIISDCEGYELELFSTAVVNASAASDLIIELHEFPGTNTRECILDRFRETHQATCFTFSQNSANAHDFPETATLGDGGPSLIRELRPEGQQWIYLTPRVQASRREK